MPICYVFISGGVFSGLGKGIVTSSIGQALQARGFGISVLKIDPYLNIDAGTMNPIEHGETYVAVDGTELDVDFGHYERMLNLEITGDQNITTGQIYLEVITKERRGDYLGQTVQIVPHITDEIKRRITDFGEKSGADFLLVELGGTVGDIEGLPFFEAIRQLRIELGYDRTMIVHTTYVPIPPHVNEFKTKPTQHSVMELRRIGLIPTAIVCRSSEQTTEKERTKISVFCNVPKEAVFSMPDMENVLEAPLVMDRQGLGDFVLTQSGKEPVSPDWREVEETLGKFRDLTDSIVIGVTGKYTKLSDSYISVEAALRHAGAHEGVSVDLEWISADELEKPDADLSVVARMDGILVPGGFGTRGIEGKINAIRYARENEIPYLGICLGFQLATLEFARNVLGIKEATSTEFDSDTTQPVVFFLPGQDDENLKMGASMRLGAHEIQLLPETKIRMMYGTDVIHERHRHRYEINPEYSPRLEKEGLRFTAYSDNGQRREALELDHNHPFFFATQFHPEFKSRPSRPSPPYHSFVKAAVARAAQQRK